MICIIEDGYGDSIKIPWYYSNSHWTESGGFERELGYIILKLKMLNIECSFYY